MHRFLLLFVFVYLFVLVLILVFIFLLCICILNCICTGKVIFEFGFDDLDDDLDGDRGYTDDLDDNGCVNGDLDFVCLC